jgi:hypothetical protein
MDHKMIIALSYLGILLLCAIVKYGRLAVA